jgi:hypothetical protein
VGTTLVHERHRFRPAHVAGIKSLELESGLRKANPGKLSIAFGNTAGAAAISDAI